MNTLSNVFHHIPHTIIEQALMEHNLTIISLITFVKAVDEELAAFKTLKTFSRQVYIQIIENNESEETLFPNSVFINYKEENFVFFSIQMKNGARYANPETIQQQNVLRGKISIPVQLPLLNSPKQKKIR